VGVVRDIKDADLRKEPGAFIYLPMRQPYDRNFRMTLSMKTAADPATMIPAIEKQVRAAGPDTLVAHTGTMVEQIDDTLVQDRPILSLTAAFGVLALLLSAVGLYGVLVFSSAVYEGDWDSAGAGRDAGTGAARHSGRDLLQALFPRIARAGSIRWTRFGMSRCHVGTDSSVYPVLMRLNF
jgi:hypothetical protein